MPHNTEGQLIIRYQLIQIFMKTFLNLLSLCIFLSGVALTSCTGKKTANVLFITGGHDYDKETFAELLAKLPITYDHVEHPNAHVMLKSDKISKYDVVLLYDMPKEISEEERADFIAMLEKGKGLVVLHHAFCSYDIWPEYVKIAGGRYHHYQWEKDGVMQKPSTYMHDVKFDIKVEDPKHPITKGISDFSIIDEAYGNTELLSTVHPLLSTNTPLNGPLVCWANNYGKSRVVTLTLGHDIQSWENPSFIEILSRSILWVAQ